MEKTHEMHARINTRQLVMMAVLIALSIVLVYLVHFPIFPAAPFLEYDPADIPILIGTFLYGPLAGLVLTVIASVIQGFTVSSVSGIIGIMMHIFATGSFVLVTGNVYKHIAGRKGVVMGLISGVITVTITMIIWNIIFTPLFMGTALKDVLPLLIPAIIPFNLVKAGVNGLVSAILYNRLKAFTHMV